MLRVVHYINQFFGQIGGEEKATVPPAVAQGPVGPGRLLHDLLRDDGEVVATVICGDNYFSENREEAVKSLLNLITPYKPDLFIAGPAFNAGRYGLACGELCKCVKEKLGIPVVTGMYPENPGTDLYKRDVYIIETTTNVAGMGRAMPLMVQFAFKLSRHEPIGAPSEKGYIPRGIKRNVFKGKMASQRAIELLLKKIAGEPFQTEISFPDLDRVPPAVPIRDLREAKIALITEGGLYPKGNPDNMSRARSTRYAKYTIAGLKTLDPDHFESIHRGFDTTVINEDPNRLLPLDVLSDMAQQGTIKEIFHEYFVTTGVATTMENGKGIGRGIAKELKESGVSCAIVTST